MTFKIGMKVVCVKLGDPEVMAKWSLIYGAKYPQIGNVYTVRGIEYCGAQTLVLEEIENFIPGLGYEPGYNASHFRPVVSPKQQVSFTTGAPKDSRKWDNRRKRVEVVS